MAMEVMWFARSVVAISQRRFTCGAKELPVVVPKQAMNGNEAMFVAKEQSV